MFRKSQDLSTSQKISIKFTIYVSVILFLVAALINSIFAIHRYHGELTKLSILKPKKQSQNIIIKNNKNQFDQANSLEHPKNMSIDRPIDNIQIIKYDADIEKYLLAHKFWRNISYIGDDYIVYAI